MRIPRVHQAVALVPGSNVDLDEAASRHLRQVLRLREGDPVQLFDGAGHACDGHVEGYGRRSARVRLEHVVDADREAPLALTLALGISKGERMDLAIQKATELGVARIVPLETERSVVRLDAGRAARRAQRWAGIAIAACEQCGRNRLPFIDAPRPLDGWLDASREELRLLPTPGATSGFSELAPSPPPRTAVVLIGPEGGLGDAERERAVAAGYAPVRLGPRVLRTETAAIAAVTAVMLRFGDLG